MWVINDSNMVVNPPVKLKSGAITSLNIQPKGRVKLPNLAVVMPNELPIRLVTEAEMMGKPTAAQLAKTVAKEGE